MSASLRRNFTDVAVSATGLILLFILFIRVTRGLDLTDEMQYYGEIKGLIETGRLFSNDLFIQQSVYILFYPLFYLFHWLFGFDGLVFFGRLLMSILSITVFLYAYRKLLGFRFSPLTASLTALSLTFAIPYHGIFAPSYNTISQVLWIIFTLRFFEWKRCSAFSWGILPIVMVFAHPTSAVMMSLLILLRLLTEREYKQLGRLLSVLLGGALIAAPVIFYFASPHEYLASLSFSSGYGVGTAFTSDKYQRISLLFVYALFGVSLLFGRLLHRLGFAILTVLFITITVKFFLTGRTGGAYTVYVVFMLSFLSAFAYGWVLSAIPAGDIKLRQQNHWLVVALLAYATTLGVTSGNGIAQATGAFMVGLPLLLGIAVSTGASKETLNNVSILKHACVLFVFALFVVHWCYYPYREHVWWRAKHSIQAIPEFRFINTTRERTAFMQQMKHTLGPVTYGRHVLIVSEYPGLYFVLGAQAETSMLYMHSLTSDKSEEALLHSLSGKKPEIVVDIFSNADMSAENSRIKKVLQNYYYKLGLNCMSGSVKFNKNSINPPYLNYVVCR